MTTQDLIFQLQNDTQKIIETTEQEVLNLDVEIVQWKENPDSWSILECYEHLNIYNRYYNVELEKALSQSSSPQTFKSGWLGNYFVKTIVPTNEKPIKTMKHVDPKDSTLTFQVVEEFLDHQRKLLQLLNQAKSKNLNPRKIRVEFLKLLRIKIGDGLRFVVAHEQRHLQQVLRTKKSAMSYLKKEAG